MRDHSDKLMQARNMVRAGEREQARALLMRTLQKGVPGPVGAAMCVLLSQILLQSGQRDQALYYAQRAVESAPADPDARVQLAQVLWAIAKPAEAVAAALVAVQTSPGSRNAHGTLVNLLMREERFGEALAAADAGLARFPGDAEFVSVQANMLLNTGRPERAVASLREAVTRDPANIKLLGVLGPACNYTPGVPVAEESRVHAAFGSALAAVLPRGLPAPVYGTPDPDRPLRVGFVSPDLRQHAMQHFLEPLLRNLDRAAFTTVCYSVCGNEDDVSRRLESAAGGAGEWRHVPTLHVGQLAELIQRDRIDILFDLAGHTRYNRLATMALRPAPVSIAAIGYPQTSGLTTIDYALGDSLCAPPTAMEGWTERLFRVDPVYFCYLPPRDVPDVAPGPCATNGHVTFGSFNTLMKLNDRVVQTWARVVNQTPGARLLVKNVQLMHEDVRRLTRERFVAAGVPEDRLEIIGHTGTMADHLRTYAKVDVALDTFPYAGMTTTCESLLMGVPVVTLAQHTVASRVGLSTLANTGMRDLVAETEDEFVAIATRLAGDTARLGSMRGSLRRALLESVVCDGPGYGERFGSMLRQVWREWCAAQSV